MSKLSGSPFGKPSRPTDAERFVEEGASALRQPPEPEPKLPPPAVAPARPATPAADTQRRSVNSYKHKEINHLRLKRLSQDLDRNMGDMLDEALEAKFAEWLAQVPPREPLF